MTDEDRRVLVLVAGEGRKRRFAGDVWIPIEHLYCTEYFSKKREFADKLADAWGVLSAKFGVVNPGKLVSYYTDTVDDIGESGCRKFAREVLDDPYLTTDDDVVLLGGRSVAEPFSRAWPRPMQDQLSTPFTYIHEIDERLTWMDEAIKTEDPLVPIEEIGVKPEINGFEEKPKQPVPLDQSKVTDFLGMGTES